MHNNYGSDRQGGEIMNINIVVADDHEVIREGIRSVIERKAQDISVIGEASDGNEVLALADAHPIDVYLLDISMPGLNGIDTMHRLLEKDPLSKIIIISMHDDFAFVEKAVRGGARGYLSKQDAIDEVLFAIRTVMAGKYFLSPNITGLLIHHLLFASSAVGEQLHKQDAVDLSIRENEILDLIAEGRSNKEIAAQLNISLSTVHSHRQNIMHKLNISRQGDLIRYVFREHKAQK